MHAPVVIPAPKQTNIIFNANSIGDGSKWGDGSIIPLVNVLET